MARGHLLPFDGAGHPGQYAGVGASAYAWPQPGMGADRSRSASAYPITGHHGAPGSYWQHRPHDYAPSPNPQDARSHMRVPYPAYPAYPSYQSAPYGALHTPDWSRHRTESGGSLGMPRPAAYHDPALHHRSYSDAPHLYTDPRSQYHSYGHQPSRGYNHSNHHVSHFDTFPRHRSSSQLNPYSLRDQPSHESPYFIPPLDHADRAYRPSVHPRDLARQFTTDDPEPLPDRTRRRTHSDHATFGMDRLAISEKESEDEREMRRARRKLERERRRAAEEEEEESRYEGKYSRGRVPEVALAPSEHRSKSKSKSSKDKHARGNISEIQPIAFLPPKPRHSRSQPKGAPPSPPLSSPGDRRSRKKKVDDRAQIFLPPESNYSRSDTRERGRERHSRSYSEYAQAMPPVDDGPGYFADPIGDSYFTKPKKSKKDKATSSNAMVIPPDRDDRYPNSQSIIIVPPSESGHSFLDQYPQPERISKKPHRGRARDRSPSRWDPDEHPGFPVMHAPSESPPKLYVQPPTPGSSDSVALPVPPPASVIPKENSRRKESRPKEKKSKHRT